MAFTIDKNLIFIDSMQFMNSSLDALVKNLSDDDFKYISVEFSGEVLELVKQKGIYPYECMNSFKRFSKERIPDKCKLFSSLKDEFISEKDYLHAIDVWNVFKMITMGDYHVRYLKTVVLLFVFANVFEKFINKCLDYYGLDLCHYFSSPGLSWDAMLKMTKIELDFISDIDLHFFIEKERIGDILCISEWHSKANNKYRNCYVSSKEYKRIKYFDANNLYGWAMAQYLPYSEFKWLNQKEVNGFCLNSIECNFIKENSSIGYILEVDLEYPGKLHELHNDYPLAPEKLEITLNML